MSFVKVSLVSIIVQWIWDPCIHVLPPYSDQHHPLMLITHWMGRRFCISRDQSGSCFLYISSQLKCDTITKRSKRVVFSDVMSVHFIHVQNISNLDIWFCVSFFNIWVTFYYWIWVVSARSFIMSVCLLFSAAANETLQFPLGVPKMFIELK